MDALSNEMSKDKQNNSFCKKSKPVRSTEKFLRTKKSKALLLFVAASLLKWLTVC